MKYFKFVYFGSFFLEIHFIYAEYGDLIDALNLQCLVADLYAAVKLPIKVSIYFLYLIH